MHASSDTTGSHSAQPHSFPPAENGFSWTAAPESFFVAGGSSDEVGDDDATGLTGVGVVVSHAAGMARISANPTADVIEQRSIDLAVYWPAR